MLTGEIGAPCVNVSLPAWTAQKYRFACHKDFVLSKAKSKRNLLYLRLNVASDFKVCLLSRVLSPFLPPLFGVLIRR